MAAEQKDVSVKVNAEQEEKGKGVSKHRVASVAAARPQVTVYDIYGRATKKSLRTPDVLLAPIRTDLVTEIHSQMAKNNRQPYAVKVGWGPKGVVAGMQVAASSWGTGRAVSRIPRVRGGGTHRAGQGAYGNMCRGGRMFAPTKIWRQWHKRINKNQKRYAVCSALAASAVPALVMARGHRVQSVDEIPLVIEDDFQTIVKTSGAMKTLQHLHLGNELKRCKNRYKRAGKGKARNRRWRHRVGPLIVYRNNSGIVRAARNIRGVDFCKVSQLNLLKLAPGGHVGRLVIFTESAFRELNSIYGTFTRSSSYKKNYHIPRPLMTNSDLNRIINSQEIQSAIRPKKRLEKLPRKKNPLKHPHLYAKLNPLFAQQLKEAQKNYKDGAKVRTTKLLKPAKKQKRLSTELSKEQKEQMQPYWDTVFGKGKEARIFKSRPLLEKEREAVRAAIAQANREKLGLDLKEAMDKAKAGMLEQAVDAVKTAATAVKSAVTGNDDSDSD